MSWRPEQNWNWLLDEVNGRVMWRKEVRRTCLAYVCYVDGVEEGFIPLEYDRACEEHRRWWEATYDSHPDGIVLRQLMNELVKSTGLSVGCN